MTQAELAEGSGVSTEYLASIECGSVDASTIPLYRIAEALDVVPMVLFTCADDGLSREFDRLRYLTAREAARVLEEWARKIQRSFREDQPPMLHRSE